MKKQMKHGIILFLALLLIGVFVLPASADLIAKTIQVYTGVNIYVNEAKINPTDANGNPVEVFIYNGTAYLPVRAISEALGTVVHWEGKTNSVYVGRRNSEQPDIWLSDLDYFTSNRNNNFKTPDEGDKDNLGNSYNNALYGLFDTTYKLNGQYSRLTGTFYQRYDQRSNYKESTFKVYADGELVYNATMNVGIEPIPFDISLAGVLELKVELDGYSHWPGYCAGLGNCGLYLK